MAGLQSDIDRWEKILKSAVERGDERRELKALTMLEAITAEPTPVEPSGDARWGRGAMDLYQGGVQAYKAATDPQAAVDYTREVNQDIGRYEAGRGPDAGFDWKRLGGTALAAAPGVLLPGAALTGLAARTLVGGGIGGAEAGLAFDPQYTPETGVENRVRQGAVGAALGAGGGAAVPPALRLLGRGVEKAAPAAGVLARRGADVVRGAENRLRSGTPGMGPVAAPERPPITLDPEALMRKEAAQAFDIDLLPGQASRDPKTYATEQNVSRLEGVGDPLAAHLQGQRAQVGNVLDEARAQYPTQGVNPENAGNLAGEAATARSEQLQEGVREAYRAVDEVRPNVELPIGEFRARMDDIKEQYDFDMAPAAVRNRVGELLDGSRPFTPPEIQKLDQLVETVRPRGLQSDARTDTVLNGVKRALLETLDIAAETGGEMAPAYRAARTAAADRFAQQAPQTVQKLINGTASDESVVKLIKGAKNQDLRSMMDFLAGDTTGQGAQAIQQIQGVMYDLLRKAATGTNDELTAGGLPKAIDALGLEKLVTLYGDDMAEMLNSLGAVTKDLWTVPPGSPVNFSNTAVTGRNLLPSLAGRASGFPLVGDLVGGMASQGARQAEGKFVNQSLQSAATSGRNVIPDAIRQDMANKTLNPLLRMLVPGYGAVGATGQQR